MPTFKGKPVKIISIALLAGFLTVASAPAEEENRYNLLGRMLHPFALVFAKETKDTKVTNRAFSFSAKLEMMTDLPPALAGANMDIALEYPDKVKIHAPLLGDDITLCRNGQDVWAYPGAKVDLLLKESKLWKKQVSKEDKGPLGPFELPIPEKEIVLVPVVFKVKDVGTETLDDAACRVLDLYLMPELAHSLKAEKWASRAWVKEDATPARISFVKPGWQISVRFQHVEFAPKLPPETWQPTAEQAGDILKLDPAHFRQILGGIVK